MTKYSKKSQKTVKEAMHKHEQGKLKSSRSDKSVKSREQAIAIGLSEARKKGEKYQKNQKLQKLQSAHCKSVVLLHVVALRNDLIEKKCSI